jgi:hypothetical protein
MPSPMTVSLEVPYADNEQQFLLLAVQAATRTFRKMNAPSDGQSLNLTAPTLSGFSSTPDGSRSPAGPGDL